MKNKIGWCDMTWNPCWGCRNHCEYCYARKIAKRFAGKTYIRELKYKRKNNIQNVPDDYFFLWDDLKNFKLNFLHSQFNKKLPKKPQRIFVGSMSEIAYWSREWIEKVIEKVKQYPQHTFQFLTRHPEVYRKYVFPENCWLGVTITKNIEIYNMDFFPIIENKNRIRFVSIEPILERIVVNLIEFLFGIDWVIIGAETGNRKGKIIPKLEWVLEIVKYCDYHKVPVYIKGNLSKYYNYKQFPIGR